MKARSRKWEIGIKLLPLLLAIIYSIPAALLQIASVVELGKSYIIRSYEGQLCIQEISPGRGRPFPLPFHDLDIVLLFVVVVGYLICLFLDQIRPTIKPISPEERWLQKYNRQCCPVCGYDIRATRDCCPECGSRIGAMAEEMRRRIDHALRKELRREEIE